MRVEWGITFPSRVEYRINAFRNAVPFWGHTGRVLSDLSPEPDCSPDRVIHLWDPGIATKKAKSECDDLIYQASTRGTDDTQIYHLQIADLQIDDLHIGDLHIGDLQIYYLLLIVDLSTDSFFVFFIITSTFLPNS